MSENSNLEEEVKLLRKEIDMLKYLMIEHFHNRNGKSCAERNQDKFDVVDIRIWDFDMEYFQYKKDEVKK